MRLLFVHERFGAMGGAEVNAVLTAQELKRRGHLPAVLHGSSTGKSEDLWREVFPARFALSGGPKLKMVEAALQEFNPHAVYVHKMADLAVIKALMNSGHPLVRMVHDHDLYCMRSYKYNPLTRNICARPASPYCVFPCGAVLARNRNGGWPLKWVSYLDKKREIRLNRLFHRMIVATQYMKRELLRNGFEPQRIEVHAPVPPAGESSLQSSFDKRNLLIYAGQIIRGKGVDVLLESLARMKVGFQCLVLGDGNHKAYCENLCDQLRLADRVTFKGYVPPGEMRAYYAEASLAVVSSVWPEPFGAVGLEAMRYGLPVVAFDAGGIGEWLSDGINGFLVPHMDRQLFANRVEQLLRDKALARKMGDRGRQAVKERFNFSAYIDGLETMFRQVIEEGERKMV